MPAIHTKLSTLANGVTLASPSPMAKVLWHHNGDGEKVIAYLGFTDPDLAKTCYDFLATQVGHYHRSADAGICKPRKAERVQGAVFELKWHRPDADLLNRFIRKDLARA